MIFFCDVFTYKKLIVSLTVLKPTFSLAKRSMWLARNVFRRKPFYLTVPKQSLIPSILKSPSNIHSYIPSYSYDIIDVTQYNFLKEAYKHLMKQLQLTTSPIAESTTPLLLTQDKPEVIKGVSGIWQVPPKILNSPEFPIITTKAIIKFTVNAFFETSITTIFDLASIVKKVLRPSDYLDVNYYYPLVQHIITSSMPFIKFPREILEEITKNKVDYKFHDDYVTTQPLIEAIVLDSVLNTFPAEFLANLEIQAQNPDNPLGSHKQYAEEAYKIMEQPHPDFVCSLRDTLSEIIVKHLFLDVKLKTDPLKSLNTHRGFISLVHKLNDYMKDQFVKRAFGDLKGVLNQNKSLSLEQKDLLTTYKDNIDLVLKDKKLSIQQKFDKFVFIQNQMDKNPELISIICSRIVKQDVDNFFDIFFKKNIEDTVDITALAEKMNIPELFTQKKIDHLGNVIQTGQQINVIAWKKAILAAIDAMPEDIKKRMLENHELFKMLEI